ncbi:hypothetical protein MTO96_004621 [Rhipicephalus appendiculatus]
MLVCGRQLVTQLRLLQHRALSSDPELVALCNSFPALRGRKTGQPEDLFHVHTATLDLLEEHLVHWPGGCPPLVLEANAGPGLLSRRLVEAGRITSRVRMFEHRQCFLPKLRAQLPMGTSLFALGRLAFLLFLSHTEAAHITASRGSNFRHYRDVSILYQLFFHVDVLGQVSRELFLPARGGKTQAPLHLVRLVPRSDLWDLAGSPERLHELVFFVRQNMVRRTAYVLPCLEKWIPGCGPRLLREALPEYSQSAFTAAVAREGS